MRTLRKVRKLSHDTFVESYGIMSRSKSVDGRRTKNQTKTLSADSTEIYGTFRIRNESHSSLDDEVQVGKSSGGEFLKSVTDENDMTYESDATSQSAYTTDEQRAPSPLPLRDTQKSVQLKGPASRRLRRFSLKKFPSTGDIHKAVTRRTKSDGNEDEKEEEGENESGSNGWLSSWHSQFSLNRLKTSSPVASGVSPKRSLYRAPASKMVAASHSGYLDRRNKKRKWERYWCVVHDSCLYCYNSPQSEYTHDAIVLRGYVVSADISDVQRSKFTFKLERKDSPTMHFRCDNHKGFMQWICTIKKEAMDATDDLSDNEILMNSIKNSTEAVARPPPRTIPLPISPSSPTTAPDTPPIEGPNKRLSSRRHTADNLFRMTRREHLDLELQKEKLLREVLEQQKEIILERNNIMPPPVQRSQPYYVPLRQDVSSPKPSRNEVMEKYEREKENQETKILKSLTQLHRRRNSVQLKIDQLAREANPKSRRSRSTSRLVLQSMEARLALLQAEMAEIDQDIREQQANKEDLAENLKHKRDLEIMVLDQQESIDIVKRQQRGSFYQERGRKTSRRISTAHSNYNLDQLTSIDETSAISDSSSTSSGSSCYRLRNASPDGVISSTPRHHKLRNPIDNICLRGGETVEKMEQDEEDYCGSYRNIGISKSSSYSSVADEIMSQGNSSVEGALSDDFRSLSTSSYSDLDGDHVARNRVSSSDESLGKKPCDIRPDVLAEIEEFEVFSRMMLQRINSTQC